MEYLAVRETAEKWNLSARRGEIREVLGRSSRRGESPTPIWRPARTAAPAAKMFSMDTMISSSGTVTPTAVRAMSECSMPI